jgi:hypothetical protein
MDRAPLVNEKFMSGWKGLNWVKHALAEGLGSEGSGSHLASRAAEKLLLRRNTDIS